MIVLTLNSGSSSLKFGLYDIENSGVLTTLCAGELESIGDKLSKLHAKDGAQNVLVSKALAIANQQEAVLLIGKLLAQHNMPQPTAIGHRIVHGGVALLQHCLIDDAVMQQIHSASVFAPLHNKTALTLIQSAQKLFPSIPQFACFDTTFHRDMPAVAHTLPIAKTLQQAGIKRYGFHGLSCESIVQQLKDDMPKRLIIAHIGNGVSVTAVKAGKSIDTSMGLTPSGGAMMGTRSGDIDPGVMIYLMRELNFNAQKIEQLIDHQSGLLGVSGISADMRQLHLAAASNKDAALAIDMFCTSLSKQSSAMITALQGVDMLVFTGGIGENDAIVRAKICQALTWFGISLDATKNALIASAEARNITDIADTYISHAQSRCTLRVIASQEDMQIARHVVALLQPVNH